MAADSCAEAAIIKEKWREKGDRERWRDKQKSGQGIKDDSKGDQRMEGRKIGDWEGVKDGLVDTEMQEKLELKR